MADFALILAAAGQSRRFQGPQNKLLEKLEDRTVIARALAAFLARPDVATVVIAASDRAAIVTALGGAVDKRVIFVDGGSCRARSVANALAAVPPHIEWVAVHDAARPLVTPALIDATLAAARRYGAAVPALGVPFTVKEADGPLPARVIRTPPREKLWSMQTPQIMRRAALAAALAACPVPLEQITDDAQLLELAGQEVWLIDGDPRNIKITTPMDMEIARRFLHSC